MTPIIRRLIDEAKERSANGTSPPSSGLPRMPRVSDRAVGIWGIRTRIRRDRQNATQSTIGAIAEMVAVVDLLNRGYDVYRAISPNAQCDLIVTHGDINLRIEVKATVVRDSKVVSRSANSGSKIDHMAAGAQGRDGFL